METKKITKIQWHTLSVGDTLGTLGSTEQGLGEQVAQKRLLEFGPNILPEKKPDSVLQIFLRQFKSPLIYVLLTASAVIWIMGESIDALVILAVLVINAIVGSIQEGKAQNTLSALAAFTKTTANVLRGGQLLLLPDEALVPGDIVLLKEGQKVPADGRILETSNLTVNEAALTGESLPVYKDETTLKSGRHYQPSDLSNMLMQGTLVVAGNGKFVVTATGKETVLGQVSSSITKVQRHTPLQQNLKSLTNIMIWVVLVVSALLFIAGLGQGRSLGDMFGVAVALAVSIIPEGLPVAITLILATGVWRMGKQRALVKKLPAVESLGQADVVAVDKTGTITKNELVVSWLATQDAEYTVTGNGFEPAGGIFQEGRAVSIKPKTNIYDLVWAATLASNAEVVAEETTGTWKVTGDPTDGALAVLGQKLGLDQQVAQNRPTQVREWAFDYKKKYRAVSLQSANSQFTVAVGALESVATLSHMTTEELKSWEAKAVKSARTGLRILAVAAKKSQTKHTPELTGLKILGLVGMSDQIKERVAESVQQLKQAGLKVVMLTGDNKHTATAIARLAGIFHPGDTTVVGQELENLSDQALMEKMPRVSVFARVTPEHKMRIIQLYGRLGQTIGMTGDGVNDAPSLVASDIGLAMGQRGTEVAKEAADIVLVDDNFQTIVAAVEEGRNVILTIRKVLIYLFSTSIGELFTIVIALLLALPLPLMAVHVLWLNFVTDGFLTLALAMQKKEPGLLKSGFKKSGHYILSMQQAGRSIYLGLLMSAMAITVFVGRQENYLLAQTACMTVLAMVQWYNAWNCRNLDNSTFTRQLGRSYYLPLATLVIIALQIWAVQSSWGNFLLKTTPLPWQEWLWLAVLASAVLWVEELRKLIWPWLIKQAR